MMLGIHGGKLPMNTEHPAFVWTIAGSDSGGGAGIQADLATIQDLGCHGCSVITTVTAQSSVAVTLVEPVSAAMLMAQLTTLLSDLPPKAIKIGLLADQSQVALLADWIASFKIHYPSVPVIVDPVMVASCGDAFAVDNCQDIKNTAKSALDFNPFKGLIELITPNVLELGRLTHSDVSTKAQFAAAAQALSQSLDCSVLAKGGDVSGSTDILDDTHAKTHDNTHVQTQANAHKSNGWDGELAEDYLVCHQVRASSELHQNGRFWLASLRVNTRHNHGSGCTLSSAIAAVLAQGFVLQDAVVVAKAYVSQGLSAAIGLGQGPGPLARTGWPNDLSRYAKIKLCDGNFISYHLNQHLDVGNDLVATVFSATDQATAQVRITSTPAQYISSHGFKVLDADLGVYPVVSDLIMLESLLVAGVKTVQLRIKTDTSGSTAAGLAGYQRDKSALGKSESGKFELVGSELEAQIQTAIALGKHFNAQLFINDHWQLAIKYHAFGVHLGQEDLAVTDLAAIQAAGLALGLSTHSYFELLLAHQYSPSYIALGHIFPTTTKQMPSAPQGLAKLKHYVALLQDHYPLVAIGGIDLDNLAKVKATGVGNIAVVRAITKAKDPVAAFAELSQAWEQCSLSEELAVKHEVAKHE